MMHTYTTKRSHNRKLNKKCKWFHGRRRNFPRVANSAFSRGDQKYFFGGVSNSGEFHFTNCKVWKQPFLLKN